MSAVLALALLSGGCETRQETLTKSRIRKVETGLLRAIYLKGQQPEKLSLNARMEFYKVPGAAIAVMDRAGIEWSRGYGVRDARSHEPVTQDTIFQAGALSQPAAAAAALALVDKGRLGLDRDISGFFPGGKVPWGPPPRAINLEQVLTHTAGFSTEPLPGYAPTPDAKKPSAAEFLEGLGPSAVLPEEPSAPRAGEVRPSGVGFAVLQVLLENITAEPFPAFARRTVLMPLGMKNSAFEAPLAESFKLNAASGHGRDGRPVEGKWLESPAAAADGLWTSPSDLAAFTADILATATGKDGKLLTAELARAMLTPRNGNRGLGFAVEGSGQDVRFHLEGRTAGFSCSLVVYPYKGQGAVVMTNSENGPLLIEEVFRAVSAAYEWPDFKPLERPLFRLDPSIYRQYVGRYQVTPDYALDVTYEDYYLVIRPTGQAPTRFYVESQTFFFSVDPYVRIQFVSDEKGRVTGLVLWQQDFKQEAKKVG